VRKVRIGSKLGAGVILATCVAEIGRITVLGQLRRKIKICETLFQWKKLGMVVLDCHPSNSEKHKIGGLWSRLAWAKSETPK
jgi:hypothetical protein